MKGFNLALKNMQHHGGGHNHRALVLEDKCQMVLDITIRHFWI